MATGKAVMKEELNRGDNDEGEIVVNFMKGK